MPYGRGYAQYRVIAGGAAEVNVDDLQVTRELVALVTEIRAMSLTLSTGS